MHSAVNGIIKRKISIMSSGISRKYHHHHHLDHLCKRQWHSQSGSWTSAADESMMICSVCGLTGLYLTQLLLCLSITSSASVTNKYSYKYLCSIYKWKCQNDLHLKRLFEILLYDTWFQDHQIKGSCGQDLLCIVCYVYEESRLRVVTEVKRELVKIHYFLWQTLALAVHVALMLPLHLISFINTRHSHSLDQLWSSRNLCHMDPVPA